MRLSGYSLTNLIKIDGSILEGGGAILRNAVSLSAIFQKPMEIYNIRAKRSTPGLRSQHAHVIRAIAQLSNGETEGVKVGSEKIRFYPQKLQGGEYTIDVVTAGSLSLLLMAIFPVAALAKSPVTLHLRGGTDVKWAPPIDYMKYVYLPMMEKIGVKANLVIKRRGHYPKGGGLIDCEIQLAQDLNTINYQLDEDKPFAIDCICGRAHAVKLPKHVVERMTSAAAQKLKQYNYNVGIIEEEWLESKQNGPLGPGAGITLWACTNYDTIIAGDGLGERGLPAEKVGQTAAQNLIEQLEIGRPIDYHLADQLIVWMGLSSQPSVIDTTKITLHTLTNIEIIKKFVNVSFEVQGKQGEPGIIRCHPLDK
ncbi:MAG: RNA 3'-terminal phosphate cyclase [Candidatus Heimdallarchaeota archaeon]|nr:RNA 3'-terminal phosphate cyclase [Candidatus Heimdallarchaeota archaeon]